MNHCTQKLAGQALDQAVPETWTTLTAYDLNKFTEVFADLMVIEFMDVVKSTANELSEHYFKQGCSEEEVLMRVNGALAVLGHIRARFKD